MLSAWRDTCDERIAVEVGIAVLAAERATPEAVGALDQIAAALGQMLEDFGLYRQADIRFHVALAQATRSPRLVTAMTETQGAMSGLIALIAHPPEVLAVANAQHRRLVDRSAPSRPGRRSARDDRAPAWNRAHSRGAPARLDASRGVA